MFHQVRCGGEFVRTIMKDSLIIGALYYILDANY